MRRISARVVVSFVFVVVLAFSCSAAETPALPPLAQGWRGAAYQGLVDKLRPRNQNNMKFIFLGEPAPCTMHDGTSGYGGFVQMKKHTLLWMHSSRLYFYLVNADGALCSLINVNDMSESTVSPQMVDVVITEEEVWVEPVTTSTYDPDMYGGIGGWVETTIRDGYYKTVTVRNVYPLMDACEEDRRSAFLKAKFKLLPLCQ